MGLLGAGCQLLENPLLDDVAAKQPVHRHLQLRAAQQRIDPRHSRRVGDRLAVEDRLQGEKLQGLLAQVLRRLADWRIYSALEAGMRPDRPFRKCATLVGDDEQALVSAMLAAADAGADDVQLEGSSYQVTTVPDDLAAVREALEGAGIEVESAELTMLPRTTVQIDDEAAARKLLRLMDALEENDDVQDVYANFDIPEGILEAVA